VVHGEVHLERRLEGRELFPDRVLPSAESAIQLREGFLVELALTVEGEDPFEPREDRDGPCPRYTRPLIIRMLQRIPWPP
jgi:hypothetical protein